MFVDFARHIVTELQTNPEWQLEVADEAGETRFQAQDSCGASLREKSPNLHFAVAGQVVALGRR